MKRYHLYIITFIAGLFLLNACQDEEMYPKKSDVPEGIPVTAQVSFTLAETKEVHTKADLGKEQENAVKDLYIFVFDYATKKLEYAHHADISASQQTKVTSGTVTFPTNALTSGKKNILAIANTDSYADFSAGLNEVEKMDDLENLYATLQENNKDVLRMTGNLIMSGYFRTTGVDTDTEKGYCEIFPATESQTTPVKLDGIVSLRHLDSKIQFDVKVDDASTKVFVPKNWQVVNVPAKSYVFENVADVSAKESDYFNTPLQPFEVFSLTPEGAYKGGSFIFYMFENRKKALGQPKDYNDRERQEKDADGLNGDYVYADPLAGYVVLTGSYYEYDKNHNLQLSADVKYTIHLGYVGDKADDFNSERNTSYIYHVTVKGVDNIILEVETSHDGNFTENQPGAEGAVVVADQSLIFDSHYETDKVVFNIDKIDNLSVLVKTPYDRNGSYEITNYADANAFTDNLTDFRWVQFAQNKMDRSKYRTDFMSYTDAYKSNNLCSIKELLQTLREHAKPNRGHANDGFWDQNGDVVYTVFVNEFYYENKPKKLDSDPDVKANWKEFVNVDNRQMYILCDTKFSADQQSSLTKSSIMVDQRSIKSIYNLDAEDLKTAWGIESIAEDKGLIFYDGGKRYDTKTNGRWNTFQLLDKFIGLSNGQNVWGNFIDFSINKNRSTTNAQYACLLRNRDLNGNGVIDPDEVRWYLPATNQYIGLWIGRDVLPPDVRLFQANVKDVTESNRKNYHFVSSNGTRFWAEEGVSTGSDNKYIQNYNIRCARNLGDYYKGSPSISDEPEDYVKADLDAQKRTEKVYLNYLNPAALRSAKAAAIVFHSEHSGGEMNRPYKAFEVYPSVSGVKIDYANKKLENDKCPKGYRIPNQRELALIAAYSTNSFANRLGCCTYSELGYKGFIYTLVNNATPNFLTLDTNNQTASRTRCIKDVD